jgi:hypothetical protein
MHIYRHFGTNQMLKYRICIFIKVVSVTGILSAAGRQEARIKPIQSIRIP